jgi:chemotaxis protein methyltransferase CheR
MAALMLRETAPATQDLEIALLLEALFQRHGFDFRAYDRPAISARVCVVAKAQGVRTISGLQERMLHDGATARALLRALSVSSVPLFDDPGEVRQLRSVLGTCLRASALPKVWLAECSGAEQAWALAILLAEEGLHYRTEVFATMANEDMLAEARHATIATDSMEGHQENYLKSGGRGQLADYFEIRGRRATLLPELRSCITWAQYSPVTDASFNEFQLILCEQALPQYGPQLRERVLRLFDESMAHFGVLGIGEKLDEEDAIFARYQPLFPRGGWYKRLGEP